MSENQYTIVDSVESFEAKLAQVREAQKKFASFTQEQVDFIFKTAALAANKERIRLAKMAVEETGMGIVEDKVIKNHFASEYIYNQYKDAQTCGIIERDEAFGIMKIAVIYIVFIILFRIECSEQIRQLHQNRILW